MSPWLFANHPMGNPPAPDGYTWSLGLLYLVWVAAVVLLYFPCRWFADLKAQARRLVAQLPVRPHRGYRVDPG